MGAILTCAKTGKTFHDPYNHTNTMWMIGLRYAESTITDHLTVINEETHLKVVGVHELKNQILLQMGGNTPHTYFENQIKKLIKNGKKEIYITSIYTNGYQQLMSVLEDCLKYNSTLIWRI